MPARLNSFFRARPTKEICCIPRDHTTALSQAFPVILPAIFPAMLPNRASESSCTSATPVSRAKDWFGRTSYEAGVCQSRAE